MLKRKQLCALVMCAAVSCSFVNGRVFAYADEANADAGVAVSIQDAESTDMETAVSGEAALLTAEENSKDVQVTEGENSKDVQVAEENGEDVQATENTDESVTEGEAEDSTLVWGEDAEYTWNNSTCVINGVTFQADNYNYTVEISNLSSSISGDLYLPEKIKVEGNYYDVIAINDSAFNRCTQVVSVNIPKSIDKLGDEDNNIFNGCIKLKAINVAENNKYYCSDDYGVLFNKNKTELRCYPAGRNEERYRIPDSVITIGIDAFQNSKLKEMAIPKTVKSIIGCAFISSTNLTSLSVPEGVDLSKAYGVFYATSVKAVWTTSSEYDALKKNKFFSTPVLVESNLYDREPGSDDPVRIKADSVKCFEKAADGEDKEIVLTQDAEGYFVHDISNAAPGEYYYKAVVDGTEYTSPVINIAPVVWGEDADYSWTDNKCTIGNVVFTADSDSDTVEVAYVTDRSMTGELRIPDEIKVDGKYYDVTGIGNNSFEGYSSLNKIVLPQSLKKIGSFALKDCINLNSIIIPASVESVGEGAFWYDTGLTNVKFAGDNTAIGKDSFAGCGNCIVTVNNDEMKDALINSGVSESNIQVNEQLK